MARVNRADRKPVKGGMEAGRERGSADPDAALMVRARGGCQDSFGLLVERYRASVIRMIARRVRDRAVAEDLAQEAFLRVYVARSRYAPVARFSTWLWRIAWNLASNWLRGRRRGREQCMGEEALFADGRPGLEQHLAAEASRRALRRAVLRLPVRQRRAVLLHQWQAMECRQVAREMGCTEGAVKSLLHRAYGQLRQELEGQGRG